jgi:hypothetical protein
VLHSPNEKIIGLNDDDFLGMTYNPDKKGAKSSANT